MDIRVSQKFSKISASKVRMVLPLLKNLKVEEAQNRLKFIQKEAARKVLQLVKSGIAAAKEKNLEEEQLVIKSIKTDQAPSLKRFRFRSRGRTSRIKKHQSHIFLVLTNEDKKDKIETSKDKDSEKKSK